MRSSLPVQAKVGDYSRVDLGGAARAGSSERDLRGGTGKGGKLTDVLAHMPPRLEVDYGQTLVTREPMLRVKRLGQRRQPGARPLHLRRLAQGLLPVEPQGRRRRTRSASIPRVALRPGINYVTVVAREDNEIMSRKTFIVRRDAPDGALLETPKESELDFLEFLESEQ